MYHAARVHVHGTLVCCEECRWGAHHSLGTDPPSSQRGAARKGLPAAVAECGSRPGVGWGAVWEGVGGAGIMRSFSFTSDLSALQGHMPCMEGLSAGDFKQNSCCVDFAE